MKFILSVLAVIGLVGFSSAQGSLLSPTLQLLDGLLGVAADVVGMQPLIDYCQQANIKNNSTLVSISLHLWNSY
jgi:hypothetical protein